VTPPAQLSRGEGERRLEAAEAEYAAADSADVAAQEAAMERMQSARAMIEVAEAA
jgi:F-type H+-transporting ATPase subunit epsilon